MRHEIDVLYTHPIHHDAPNQVPMGVAGIINALPDGVRRSGVYSDEVTDEPVQRAAIIALDLHWFFPLCPLEALVRRCCKLNPRARVVLGGYTASIHAAQLIRSAVADSALRWLACHADVSVGLFATSSQMADGNLACQRHRQRWAEFCLMLDAEEVVKAIRKAVAEHRDLRVHAAKLTRCGTIPKTSGGKIRRHACRAAFAAGTLSLWEATADGL